MEKVKTRRSRGGDEGKESGGGCSCDRSSSKDNKNCNQHHFLLPKALKRPSRSSVRTRLHWFKQEDVNTGLNPQLDQDGGIRKADLKMSRIWDL